MIYWHEADIVLKLEMSAFLPEADMQGGRVCSKKHPTTSPWVSVFLPRATSSADRQRD